VAGPRCSRPCPPNPTCGTSSSRGTVADIYQALPVPERRAWLTSYGFLIHATKKEVSVI
jgi:hypothetical protein